MINIDLNNLIHQAVIVFLILMILYLGWKIRKAYKRFMFFIFKRKGIKGEKDAIKLLKKNGYEILSYQHKMKGYLYEDGKKIFYLVRPDFLVRKNYENYVAEVKTGLSAFIGERNTRRQLLEYSKLYNSDKVLLVDLTRKSIKVIEF